MPDHQKRPADRYPGYDVMKKRFSPSWNDQTRRVIERRMATSDVPAFFTPGEFETVRAIAARIVPQRDDRPIPVAALVDRKLHEDIADGYRVSGMPRQREAWRLGLKAVDAEAGRLHGASFAALMNEQQDALLRAMEKGELSANEWSGMKPGDFFKKRLAPDIVMAYYAHPAAWNEIGWGGPASPRGYVRLGFNDRDPWEAAEAKTDDDVSARRINRDVG
jgi:hypothetical protein